MKCWSYFLLVVPLVACDSLRALRLREEPIGRVRVAGIDSPRENIRAEDLLLEGSEHTALVLGGRSDVAGTHVLAGAIVAFRSGNAATNEQGFYLRTGLLDGQGHFEPAVAHTLEPLQCEHRAAGVLVRAVVANVTLESRFCAARNGSFEATTRALGPLPSGMSIADETRARGLRDATESTDASCALDSLDWQALRTTVVVVSVAAEP